MSTTTAPLRTFTLNFTGDVMLGRLIDQMYPTHNSCEPSEAHIARSFLSTRATHYSPETVWGNTLPLLHEADLTLINLETAVTTHDVKFDGKVFNYRMHPSNISALKAAKIAYAGLANNHTLDFREQGLDDTVQTLKKAGVPFAGAGESREEARRPAVLTLPSKPFSPFNSDGGASRADQKHKVHVWAACDHPDDWRVYPGFHFIDYSPETRARLKELTTLPPYAEKPSLKIFSVHWGPNYEWHPSKEIRELAHFLVDECGIDIVHGHSSHHVRGVEVYRGKLIIYGCGDFVDDYALVERYRNDLGAIWRVVVGEKVDEEGNGKSLEVKRLEILPTKIEKIAVRMLKAEEKDARWIRERVKELSRALDTEVETEEGGEGKVIVHIS